jgi:hypothetical protein
MSCDDAVPSTLKENIKVQLPRTDMTAQTLPAVTKVGVDIKLLSLGHFYSLYQQS